jgi:orotate phosphoribosyltransferase
MAREFMGDIAGHHSEIGIDTVIAPAVGGILVSYEVARLLGTGTRALFMEREGGVMKLRRGFRIDRGERILVVEDVITTGGSVVEVYDALRAEGGIVVGFASIVNRSSGRFTPDEAYYCCVELEVPIYAPNECPLCRENIPAIKPGSRGLSA